MYSILKDLIYNLQRGVVNCVLNLLRPNIYNSQRLVILRRCKLYIESFKTVCVCVCVCVCVYIYIYNLQRLVILRRCKLCIQS